MSIENDNGAELLGEAHRILAAAGEQGVLLRLMGGLAIKAHSEGPLPEPCRRSYADLDFASTRRHRKGLLELFDQIGYDSKEPFNTMNPTRMVFYDRGSAAHVDIFMDAFEMCHRIELGRRLDGDPVTIPLAELLLTKLQIVELNRKDQLDVFAVLAQHEVGHGDSNTINGPHIAGLCASDWGLWRTVSANMTKIRDAVQTAGLGEAERQAITAGLDQLSGHIDAQPKPMAWRARARIGDRKRWYNEPEEVDHGAA